MTLGPVRVTEAGLVVTVCAKMVCNAYILSVLLDSLCTNVL